MLRQDLADVVKFAKALGYKIELVTNGSLLTKEKIEELKNIGLDSFAISVDGPDYESYSRIRKVDIETYNKVLSAIDNVLAAGIRLKINTVAFQSNFKMIPILTKWCIGRGISEHGIYYYTAVGRGERNPERSVDPKIWLDFIKTELMPLSDQIKLSIEWPYIENDKLQTTELRCLAEAERHHLQILPDGNVYPCAIMASYRMSLANLHTVKMSKLWNNKKLWDAYWEDAKKHFCNDSCVDFGKSFEVRPEDNFKFVCPLRKFSAKDCGSAHHHDK